MKSDAAPIRPAIAADFPAILALNAALVHFLSPLDAARLQALHAQAAYHRVAEIDLERHARTRTPSILDDGWDKCVAGITSVDEVLRVTREE